MPNNEMKVKITLIGEPAVGKTSLINRYVRNIFSEDYLATIGTRVSKKRIMVRNGGEVMDVPMTLVIWDIIGQKGFRELLKQSYFYGSHGTIAVCDLSRQETVWDIIDWIKTTREVSGDIPTVILANKSDLGVNDGTLDVVKDMAEILGAKFVITSAKSGENVEEGFALLAREVFKNLGENA